MILQKIFFCVQHLKETHTGLKQLEGDVYNDKKNNNFWVNYLFKYKRIVALNRIDNILI